MESAFLRAPAGRFCASVWRFFAAKYLSDVMENLREPAKNPSNAAEYLPNVAKHLWNIPPYLRCTAENL